MPEYQRANSSAIDVADYLLFLADQDGKKLDALSLQKLIYFAQCWSLLDGSKLYDEDTEAWVNGPVVREVWERHQGGGSMSRGDGNLENLDASQKEMIRSVWESMKHLSANELKLLTHAPGGAWAKARKGKHDGTPSDSPLALCEMAREAAELSRQAEDELSAMWDDLAEFQG